MTTEPIVYIIGQVVGTAIGCGLVWLWINRYDLRDNWRRFWK